MSARRIAGSYGLLSALALELGNSHTASPTSWGAKMPARGREGGGGVVAKRWAVMAQTG
jgi:hypothetical protein